MIRPLIESGEYDENEFYRIGLEVLGYPPIWVHTNGDAAMVVAEINRRKAKTK